MLLNVTLGLTAQVTEGRGEGSARKIKIKRGTPGPLAKIRVD
jgi:hypothetical protein